MGGWDWVGHGCRQTAFPGVLIPEEGCLPPGPLGPPHGRTSMGPAQPFSAVAAAPDLCRPLLTCGEPALRTGGPCPQEVRQAAKPEPCRQGHCRTQVEKGRSGTRQGAGFPEEAGARAKATGLRGLPPEARRPHACPPLQAQLQAQDHFAFASLIHCQVTTFLAEDQSAMTFSARMKCCPTLWCFLQTALPFVTARACVCTYSTQ